MANKGEATSMSESIFLPIVTVSDGARVTIDWACSYSHTVDDNGEHLTGYDVYNAGPLLDALLGDGTEADRLRRLADWIDHIETAAPQRAAS